MRLQSLTGGKLHALIDAKVGIGIVEINIREDISQESFRALESIF